MLPCQAARTQPGPDESVGGEGDGEGASRWRRLPNPVTSNSTPREAGTGPLLRVGAAALSERVLVPPLGGLPANTSPPSPSSFYPALKPSEPRAWRVPSMLCPMAGRPHRLGSAPGVPAGWGSGLAGDGLHSLPTREAREAHPERGEMEVEGGRGPEAWQGSRHPALCGLDSGVPLPRCQSHHL